MTTHLQSNLQDFISLNQHLRIYFFPVLLALKSQQDFFTPLLKYYWTFGFTCSFSFYSLGEETETIVEPVAQIFENKRFTVKRFNEEQVVLINERIEEFGGQIVEDINECDYIVVPLSYQQSTKKQKKEVFMLFSK